MYFRFHFSDLQYVHDLTCSHIFSQPETLPLFKLFYLSGGEACVTIGGQQIHCAQGDIVLITPMHDFYVYNLGSNAYDYYLVSFTEFLIPSDITSCIRYSEGGYHLSGSIIPELFTRFDWHLAHTEKSDLLETKMLFRCVLTEILVYFAKEAGKQAVIPGTLTESIAPVLDFISRNLERPLQIEDICKEFHYSRSHLCKIFTQTMGIPLMQYIRTERANYAEKLLKAGMSASDVAHQLGYSDYSSFYRLYRKYAKRKPSDTHKFEDTDAKSPIEQE